MGRGGGYTPTPRGEMSTIGDGNYSSASMAGGGLQDSEQPEHYDIENASSIAPSDIDIIYHYKVLKIVYQKALIRTFFTSF